MSEPGFAQISRFSRFVWVIGALGIAVAAFFVVPQVALRGDGRIVVDNGEGYAGDRVYPQHVDDPVELALEGDTLSGDQQGGWLAFDADSTPLMLRMAHEHDNYINIFQTSDIADLAADRAVSPESLGALWDLDDVVYAVPAATDGRLWVSVDSARWDLSVTPVAHTPIADAAASGTGDAMLSYEGDALSARFSHTDSGFLRVTVIAPEQFDLAVNDVDEFSRRASWRVPGTVLFMIESSGGEWSVAVDE